MGEWQAATTYPILSIVRYGGGAFIATKQNTNVLPTGASNSNLFWMSALDDGDDLDDVSAGQSSITTTQTATPVTFSASGDFSETVNVITQNGAEDTEQIETTFTLYANGWQGSNYPYYQRVAIPDVTADGVNFITPPDNVTEAALKTLYSANFGDGGQKNGEITVLCYGDVPATDVTLKITIFNN